MSTIHRGGQQAGNHPAANGATPDPANAALKRKIAQGKPTVNRNLNEPGAIPLARSGNKSGPSQANLAQALATVQGRGAASTAQSAAALSTTKAPGQPQSKIVRAPSNPTTNAARREASTNFEVAMPTEGRKQGEGGGQGQGQGQGHSQGQGHQGQGQGQGRGRGEGGRDNRQSNPSESWVPPSAQLAPKSRVSSRYLDQHGMSAKESRPSRNGQGHGSHAAAEQGVPARMLNYAQNLVATMLGRSPEQFQARGESAYRESQKGRDDHRLEQRQPPFRSTRLSVPVEKPSFHLGDMFRQLVSGGQGRLRAG